MTRSHDAPSSDHSADRDDELARLTAELPRSLDPPRDLWASIEPRLESRDAARRDATPRTRARAVDTPQRRPGRRPAWLRVAAAAAWMALGALLVLGGQRALDDPTDDAPALVAASSATEAETAPRAVPASFGDGRRVELVVAEAELLRAKDELWLGVLEQRDELPPEILDVVSQNLEIIDRAVDDLRAALAHDPANPRLEQALLDSHKRSLELLRRVALEA